MPPGLTTVLPMVEVAVNSKDQSVLFRGKVASPQGAFVERDLKVLPR